MQKPTFLILLLFSLLSCRSSKNEIFEVKNIELGAGKLERIPDFKSNYISPRNVDVWLPPGYDPKEEYASLYMLDGQMLFDAGSTWNGQEWGVDETLNRLISSGEIPPVIVIGIWNAGAARHAEYFPQKPFNSLSQKTRDSLMQGGEQQQLFERPVYSDDFLRFLVKELRPFIAANYSIKEGPENTFIAGSSMGGLMSWYALCEYPQIFGGAACLSTHWPGTFTTDNNPIPAAFLGYLDRNLPAPKDHKLYFDYGTETLDAMYEPFQQEVDELMQAHGYSSSQWETRKFEGADHSENSWKQRLHVPLKFLLGEREQR